jgi:spermidine synthase
MTDAARGPPLVSVALVSAAALAAEIVLSRLFAVVHWHHFAYMVIGLALLGFGASGTFLAIAHRRLLPRLKEAYLASVAAFAVLVVASPLLARELPFRAEALLWDPRQPLWLLLVFLVLALPFFCAATAIGLALVAFRQVAGRVYAADLAGAGLGSLGVLLLLYVVWPEDVLRVLAAAGLLALCAGALELRVRHAGPIVAAAALGLVAVAALPTQLLRFEPGPYKGLSQALLVEGTRVTLERTSPLGRLSVIESRRVPLRSAPGLSLGSVSEPPPQLGIYTDGDDLHAVTSASDDPVRLAFLEEATSALAYRLGTPEKVLVVGAGGGMEVLRARRLGAGRVDVVEHNPQLVRLLTRELDGYTGGLFSHPAVRLHAGDVRGFLVAGDRRYDLIQVSLAGGSGGGGLGGLNEDYLHTVESFRLLLEHLEPGGFLSMTRWAQVPPRDGLKLVATVSSALTAAGVTEVADRLLMIRGWQTVTLLVKNGRVTPEDVRRLREFSDALSFDAVWFPGVGPAEVNLYNQLPGPWYYDGVRQLLGSGRDEFIAAYPFDIRPATDERPYFHNFFRWEVLAGAWHGRDRGGMALLEAGYLLLAGTLVLALLAALVLILLPLALFTSLDGVARPLRWRVFAYFTGIGLAFLFVEVAFLQKLVLLVHLPTVALALVLSTFLLGAGAGSAWSSRVPPGRSQRALAGAVAGIVLLGALYGLAFDALNAALGGWTAAARAAVGTAMLAPLAFCMGLPFPLAMRGLDEPLVPWAWGINGCASVVSAALATLLAVDFGFAAVLALALGLYAVVLAVFPGARVASAGPDGPAGRRN